MSVGIAHDSIIRAKVGINYALTSAMNNDNCSLPTSKLVKSCQRVTKCSGRTHY